MGIYSEFAGLGEKIEHLRLTGSSLTMNWGEDANGVWEVAWITSGTRFCGFSSNLSKALDEAEAAARNYFLKMTAAHG